MNDLRVDPTTIERQLAELWRTEQDSSKHPVTKAALWNVIAHTWTSDHHAHATEVLARASAAVPQRTIVVRADPEGHASISSWISANCHLIGGGRQVCSEEVSIVASGDDVEHVPPLVSALLLPDMPVAVWWVGDLPRDHHEYASTLLDPADRLIFDSAQFESGEDLDFIARIARETTTAPADLNWGRIEEWRSATAALFDPPPMRSRLRDVRSVRVQSGGGASFGERSEALLYVAWLMAQTGKAIAHEYVDEGSEAGISMVEMRFDDGSSAVLRGDRDRGVVISTSGGMETEVDCVTRSLTRAPEDLVVRLLKRPEADGVYLKALAIASEL